MGSFRMKRVSSPTLWQQHQSSAVISLVLEGCRTIALLLLAGAVGLLILRLLPAESSTSAEGSRSSSTTSVASVSTGGVLVDGLGHVTKVEDGGQRNKYDLAAVIFNRVFKEDLFNITSYENYQWVEYMLFAGVEHIYWYDTAHSDEESQEVYLKDLVKRGVLTYHRFHRLYPGNVEAGYHFEQDHSYEHFLASYGENVDWVVEMDVDEYPYMVTDQKKGFLKRYVHYLERSRPDVTQILLPCMIFGGNPKGDLENGWVIERYQRRKRTTEGRTGFSTRTKPIFQPRHVKGVSFFDPHQFQMTKGDSFVTSPDLLRMNHYWGPRMSDFKPDTASVLALLVPDTGAQEIATELKASSGLINKKKALDKWKKGSWL